MTNTPVRPSASIAAIYARKSTEQNGVADDQKSVARQVEHARTFAASKGWTVEASLVFVDDGISGAEFANRPGFLRLMNALKPRPAFQVLIVSELSRLGREQFETGYAVKQLAQAGVTIYSYLENRELLLDSATNKFLMSAVSFAAEIEREKARQRVHDAMARKARAGHVTGGKVFGYDNAPVTDANGKRSHVARRVNATEAAIVRRLFALSADGVGYSRIAKLLNAERAPAPRPKAGRPSAWSPSTVKVVLDRRLYLGEVVWNRTEKRDQWGRVASHTRPSTEWITLDAPELRIISPAQWQAAHARLDGIRAHLLTARGGGVGRRRARDLESRYLLAGFARCGCCGGGLAVTGGSHRSGRPHSYGCLSYHKRGRTICGNGLKIRVERVDRAVLRALGGDVLRPAVVMAVVDGVLEALTADKPATRLDAYKSELLGLAQELDRLTEAIAHGGPLDSLLVALKARQGRRSELLAAIAAADQARHHQRVDRRGVERHVRERLADWQGLLTDNVADGRELLRRVLARPLTFTPVGRTYRFEGEASVGALLQGAVGLPTFVVPVRGFEPRFDG
jgi:site-specific DNA recombinase